MREIICAKIIGELRARMDKEAADKKCSMSELIRQKIIFAYEAFVCRYRKIPNFIFTYHTLSIAKVQV